MKLLVTKDKSVTFRVPRRRLSQIHQSIQRQLREPFERTELHFVRSRKMRRLNEEFRDKPQPTDVLSFQSRSEGLLGSIVIDIDTATKQAKDYSHSVTREILELFVHGCLHLRGFDHERSSDAKVMRKWEQKFSRKLDEFISRS